VPNTRYIKKSSTGSGWDVVKEGHRRATAHGGTKKEAVQVARKIVSREGGGEIRVMNRAGKIVDADTVRASTRRAAKRSAA
jgi:hypothetical protein